MKKLQTNPQVIIKFSLPYMIFSIAFYCLFPQHVSSLFFITLICAIPCIQYFIWPNHGDNATNIPPRKVISIFTVQCLTWLTFIGCYKMSINLTQNLTPRSTTTPFLTLLHYGLFPWILCLVLALALNSAEKKHPHSVQYSNLILPIKTKPLFHIVINKHFSILNTIAFSFTCSLYCIYCMTLFFPQLTPIKANWNLASIGCVVILLFMTLSFQKFNPLEREKFKTMSLWFYYAVLCIITALFIGFLYTLITTLKPSSLHQIPLLQTIRSIPINTIGEIITLTWWLLWVPALTLYFAKTIKPYKTKQTMISFLLFPSIITAACALIPTASLVTAINSSITLPISMIAFMTLLIILTLPKNKINTITLIHSTLKKPKFRTHTPFQLSSTGLFFISTSSLLVGGIELTNILIWPATLLALVYLAIAVFNSVKSFKR